MPRRPDPERYLESAWGLMRGQQVKIKVVFSTNIAPWIAERVWHPTQILRWVPGKRLEMSLQVADTPEIRRWLMGFGVVFLNHSPSSG